DVFVDRLRTPVDIPRRCPGLAVGSWIIDCRLVMEGALVGACPAFHDMHLIRMGMTKVVEPGPFIKVDDIDDESVALPFTNGVAEPRCALELVIRRVRTVIHEDLAPDVSTAFEDHVDALEFRLL